MDLKSHLLKSNVPSIAVSDALSPPEPPSEAMLAARQWWRKPRDLAPALVLAGHRGVGKSTAAAWACAQWAKAFPWNSRPTGANPDPLVWLGPADMQRIARRDEHTAAICDRASRAALLVVDDAGHDGSRPAIEALCDVMHERCDKGKALILTTNLTSKAFTARYGEPLADRLRACAVAPVLRERASMRQPRKWK